MKKTTTSFWEKPYNWFLIFAGILIIATIVWGGEGIDIKYNAYHFQGNYGMVNAGFTAYFLVIAFVYYWYERKGYVWDSVWISSHICCAGLLMLRLYDVLGKCGKVTAYQARGADLRESEIFREAVLHGEQSLIEYTFILGGFVLFVGAWLIINVTRAKKV